MRILEQILEWTLKEFSKKSKGIYRYMFVKKFLSKKPQDMEKHYF